MKREKILVTNVTHKTTVCSYKESRTIMQKIKDPIEKRTKEMCNLISTKGNAGYDPWDSILHVLDGQKFRNLVIVEWLCQTQEVGLEKEKDVLEKMSNVIILL